MGCEVSVPTLNSANVILSETNRHGHFPVKTLFTQTDGGSQVLLPGLCYHAGRLMGVGLGLKYVLNKKKT